jgi:hypothetical protein
MFSSVTAASLDLTPVKFFSRYPPRSPSGRDPYHSAKADAGVSAARIAGEESNSSRRDRPSRPFT